MSELKGLIKTATELVGEEKELPSELYSQLHTVFDHCLNNSTCPCESGKNFGDCCKLDFLMIQRYKRNFKRKKLEQVKEVKKEIEDDLKGVEWICKVGLKDGVPVVIPADTTKAANPLKAASVLMVAAMELQQEGMRFMALQTAHTVVNQSRRQPVSSKPLPRINP